MQKVLGKVTKEKDGFKVVFDRHLNHPIEKVWDAITNPEKLKVWFTDFEMELKEGSDIKIIFRDEAKTVTNGQILEVKPPYRFVWTWEGELAVWELFDNKDNTCRLVFTYSKLDDKYAVGASAGFQTLVERLEMMLNGKGEPYAFGTEEHDPEQVALRETYGEAVYDQYPELEKFHPVHLEKTFDVSARTLWEALTDNDKLRQWYFDFKGAFKAEEGHEFDWMAGPPDGKQWLHRGKVLEVIPLKKLIHSWEFPGYSGQARLSWELEEIEEKKTLLKLHFDFIEPFDLSQEALRRKNFAAGWNEIVNNYLPTFLQG